MSETVSPKFSSQYFLMEGLVTWGKGNPEESIQYFAASKGISPDIQIDTSIFPAQHEIHVFFKVIQPFKETIEIEASGEETYYFDGIQTNIRPLQRPTIFQKVLENEVIFTDILYSDEDIIAYEVGGNAALIKGDYKITLNRGGTNDNRWHLYNITQDPGETERLETVETAIFFDLLSEYETYASVNGVIPVPHNYHQPVQILRNGIKAKLKNSLNTPSGIIFTLILVTIIVLLIARKLMKTSRGTP